MKGNYQTLWSESTDAFDMELRKRDDGSVFFWRQSRRSRIINQIGQYTVIKRTGKSHLEPITYEVGMKIVDRIRGGEHFSSCFLFPDPGAAIPESLRDALKIKSRMEERYTSTGSKFWLHEQSMKSYLAGTGKSIISTHISPEGSCNLACPYCSVTYRKRDSRLDLSVIRQYVNDLKTRGLKAVILTGGGEPTLYPAINELMAFLYEQDLKLALISNGTQLGRVEDELLNRLTWMRISINVFPGWQEKIRIRPDLSENVTLGFSFVYTPQHQMPSFDTLAVLRDIKKVADRVNAKYVRLLPNCLLGQQELLLEHMALAEVLADLDDPRFFHQGKVHEPPVSKICHQSFFRPYLSEEPYPGETTPGSVFPCDSVVLNADAEHFDERYVVCRPGEVLDYLDRKISAGFDPRKDCTGCVFTANINMLERFVTGKEDRFDEFRNTKIEHVEFV